ncbi:MAG: hypothetical protein ABUT20_01880 [Bacteroidota bacterium]
MESNFDNRDFEQFVKQNADQYRMFPSEKVWQGVYSTLHTRRRWFGIGLTLLLVTMSTVTWVMLSSSGKSTVSSTPANISQNSAVAEKEIDKPLIDITANKQSDYSRTFIAGIKNWQKPAIIIDNKEEIENESIVLNADLTAQRLPISIPITSLKGFATIENKEPELLVTTNTINVGIINDNNPDFLPVNNAKSLAPENSIQESKELYPLSIESVLNSYSGSSRKKWLWQVYFAPTISYRKLIENKSISNSAQTTPFNYSIVYDINSVVTHKPDMGFELGFSAAYPLSKNIRLTTGLQFNVSKYDIRAYNYPTEFATVALNTGSGSNSSVSTATNYRNFDGYKTNWLHNLYLSASLPLGAELKLSGDTKNYIGIGGTIQPTYILGDRAYMISTDYKNYVEIPQLIRKWNVNSSFEAFAGYSTGKINWKVGPQVRYQLLSSFQKKYPVKEHLFDFGLKVGIMLNQ